MAPQYSGHAGPVGSNRGGAIAAQEFAIGLTELAIKNAGYAIIRLRHVYEMVRINSLPRLKDRTIDPRAAEAIVRNVNDAARYARGEEAKERERIAFLKKQMALQKRNLARLKGLR